MSASKNSPSSNLKLNAFIKLLKGNETILEQQPSEDQRLRLFLKELEKALTPYKNIDAIKFVNIVSETLEKNKVMTKMVSDYQGKVGLDLQNMSLEDLGTELSKDNLSKEQLLELGEKRFGLSSGTLRKSKKVDILSQIMNAMQNIETLDAIKRKAGE